MLYAGPQADHFGCLGSSALRHVAVPKPQQQRAQVVRRERAAIVQAGQVPEQPGKILQQHLPGLPADPKFGLLIGRLPLQDQLTRTGSLRAKVQRDADALGTVTESARRIPGRRRPHKTGRAIHLPNSSTLLELPASHSAGNRLVYQLAVTATDSLKAAAVSCRTRQISLDGSEFATDLLYERQYGAD
jgi:hypothetical protein